MTSHRTRRRCTAVATAPWILLAVVAIAACGRSTGPAGSSSTTTVEPDPGPAAVPPALVGSWVAEHFITVGALRPIPSSAGAGIRFDGASTVDIETGCSSGSAPVTFAADDTIVFGELALTRAETCSDADADLERRLVELFGHPLSWDVRDGHLKLLPTDVTDAGLILGAAPVAGIADVADGADVGGVLAAAADARVRLTNGFDTPNVFSSVAILDTYGVPTDDGTLRALAGPVAIPADARRAVEVALGPITVEWVGSAAEVATEPAATWDERPLPALLTLAEPVVDGDNAVVVSDLQCGPGCLIGGGQAFTLVVGGTWILVGPVGTQWQT